MNPRDALNLLDQVGANFEGKRQDHLNIQQAVMALRVFIEQHDPLDPGAAHEMRNEGNSGKGMA